MSQQEVLLPERSLLDDDEKGISELASEDGEGVNVKVQSWAVAESIKHGYIIPGFRLIDYIRSTWLGFDTDKKNPLHPDKPRTRFHLINIWGEQGSAKTSFASQLLGLSYGAYEPGKTSEERVQIWKDCQKVMVVNRADLIEVAALVSEPNERLKVVCFDDLNSIIPRQLAWEDRELYRKTFELLGMIRRKTGTIITTEPNIEMVIEAFKEVMTMEVIVYPNATYKAERMCHDIHPYFRAQDRLTKIIIAKNREFNPYDTPAWWWDEYQKRTNIQGNEAFQKVIKRMSELENGGGKEAEAKSAIKSGLKINADHIISAARDAGFKGSQAQAELLVKVAKEQIAKKALEPEPEV